MAGAASTEVFLSARAIVNAPDGSLAQRFACRRAALDAKFNLPDTRNFREDFCVRVEAAFTRARSAARRITLFDMGLCLHSHIVVRST